MSDPGGGVSAGEIGGIIAGLVGGIIAIGKGFAWLLNLREERAASRTAKLDAWHAELAAREAKADRRDAEYQQHIETEIRALKVQNLALRAAFNLVAAPLRELDPMNPALRQAQDMLTRAFPLDPHLPEDMGALMQIIDQVDPAA